MAPLEHQGFRISDDLRRAYEAAEYAIQAPRREVVLKIGQKCGDLFPLLGAERIVTILTASNPFSEALSDSENAFRNSELKSLVRAAGLVFLPAEGRDPHGLWSPEASLAIIDASNAQIDNWIRTFGQNAAVVARRGGNVELLYHPDARTSHG